MEKLTTENVIKMIDDCGGFCNWRHWSLKDVAVWVKSNYGCSNYVAKKVAERITK